MNQDTWQRVESIFHQALDVPDEQRSEVVRNLAQGESAIVEEVLSLLDHYRDDDEWLEEESLNRLRKSVEHAMELLSEGRGTPAGTSDRESSKVPGFGKEEDQPSIPGLQDRFEYQETLGRGGMGMVARFFDRSLERQVAIKFLRPNDRFSSNGDHRSERERFLRESRAVARLQSDHIVSIYEVIDQGEVPCLVMEWIRGPSIRKWIDSRKRIPPKMAAEIIRQAAIGLGRAHASNQIHRDIKPSNILLQRKSGSTPWRTKIIDFGLARTLDSDQNQTMENVLRGTPVYMSPEQLLGRGSIDARCDLYSLGVTLYEMLCGEPPFRGSPSMMIRQIELMEPRPLRDLDDQIPKDLESICLKLLSKDPRDRYASADELADDLGRFLAGQPTKARPLSYLSQCLRWSRRNATLATWISIAALLVVALLIGSLTTSWLLWRKNLQVAEQQKLAEQALVARIPVSDPGFLALAIDRLRDSHSDPVTSLHQLWKNHADAKSRLNIACALTAFGEPMEDYLIDQVEFSVTSPELCRALAEALSHSPSRSLEQLNNKFQQTRSTKDRARLSVLAMQLGSNLLSEEMCDPSVDPDARTIWIHQLPEWYASKIDLIHHVQVEAQPHLGSAILLGLGKLEAAAFHPDESQMLKGKVGQVLQNSPHFGLRGAARWVATTRGWNEWTASLVMNSNKGAELDHGFEMVRIPHGSFIMGNDDPSLQYEGREAHRVTLTRDFLLADREISIQLYRSFLDDTAYPDEKKPDAWREWAADEVISPTSQHPVQKTSWFDAVLFCNWLSRRDSLEPVYYLDPSETVAIGTEKKQMLPVWKRDGDANGYRLPTEAEFEYACRAGTQSKYSFGNDRHYLESYASWSANTRVATHVSGTLMPNPWGLFDMHGNVWEWTEDWHVDLSDEAAIDPIAIDSGQGLKSFRGGGVFTFSGDPISSSRGRTNPSDRFSNLGFRVARNGEDSSSSRTRSGYSAGD